MGEIFGAIGSVAGAAIQAAAIKDAARIQTDALKEARQFVFENLDPNVVNAQAAQASVNQAINRLALQGKIDPALLEQRYKSEAQISDLASQLGTGEAQAVGTAAAAEALGAPSTAAQGKQALIDAALQQIQLGATLPPDVQAELVQTGLEQTGKMTGTASPTGVGNQLLKKIIGSAGLQLQAQRQQQAAALLNQAQQLETSRASILSNLFPNLSGVQLNTLKGAQGVLEQSNEMLPQVGLNAQDIANIWLGRVGQTASIQQKIGDVAGKAATSMGTAFSNLAGGLGQTAAAAWPTVSGWLSPSSKPQSGVVNASGASDWTTGYGVL